MIVTLGLGFSQAFLIRGDDGRAILVDTGNPGQAGAILRHAADHGVAPEQIGLILLSHGHLDHFGSAAAVARASGAPIAIHRADLGPLKAGRNPRLRPTGLEGAMVLPLVQQRIAPIAPDLVFDDTLDLRPYGVRGRAIPTPGHSPGSISVLLDDGPAIVADLLVGGWLGGRLRPSYPNLPYFIDDWSQLWRNLRTLLDHEPTAIYTGHGGPLAPAAVRRRFERQLSSRPNAAPMRTR
jgi:glyoxylase-like metal-dependent hydrolase (beta-lactamase superfamily II)